MLLFLTGTLISINRLSKYLFGVSQSSSVDLNTEKHSCRSTRSWLKKKGIEIVRVGTEDCVFKTLVDFEIQKEICQNLIITNPNNWEEIFIAGTDDEEMISMIVTHFKNCKSESNACGVVLKGLDTKSKYSSKHFDI